MYGCCADQRNLRQLMVVCTSLAIVYLNELYTQKKTADKKRP